MKLFTFIIYYNLYGERQICKDDMATVVGIFKDCFKKKKLPVVKLGIQARRFTHVYDTVKVCIFAWKK